MTASPRNLALAAVLVAYLCLFGILAGSIWDDHDHPHHQIAAVR